MTHIVSPDRFPSKKSFKEAVHKDASAVYVDDPSIFPGAKSGPIPEVLEEKEFITVTNHPNRSWFAEVRRQTRGKYKGQIRVR